MKPPENPTVEKIRAALIASERSLADISRETGLNEVTLSRFRGKVKDLSGVDALGRLASALGLEVQAIPTARSRKIHRAYMRRLAAQAEASEPDRTHEIEADLADSQAAK